MTHVTKILEGANNPLVPILTSFGYSLIKSTTWNDVYERKDSSTGFPMVTKVSAMLNSDGDEVMVTNPEKTRSVKFHTVTIEPNDTDTKWTYRAGGSKSSYGDRTPESLQRYLQKVHG